MPTAAALAAFSTEAGRRTVAAGDLRHRLRSATADAHARLDAALGAFDLHSRAGYRAFLEANAAALLPLESALGVAGVQRMFPDWEQRMRSGAILADLAGVGGVARPLMAPRLDFAGVLGTMYVLEGSRLGAKLLVKIVGQSRDPGVSNATAYLRHGTGQLWPSFLVMLERHAAALPDDAGAVAAALRAFALFAAATPSRHAAEIDMRCAGA
jgi:heme oxygenase